MGNKGILWFGYGFLWQLFPVDMYFMEIEITGENIATK